MYNLNEEIGKRIVGLRKKNHLTQEQLAEILDISTKHCSCVERGVSSLSLELFIELCDVFDTTLDYLIRGKTNCGTTQIPPSFIACFENANENELSILRDYAALYSKIRSLNKDDPTF